MITLHSLANIIEVFGIDNMTEKEMEKYIEGYAKDAMPFDSDNAVVNGLREALKRYRQTKDTANYNSYAVGLVNGIEWLTEEDRKNG